MKKGLTTALLGAAVVGAFTLTAAAPAFAASDAVTEGEGKGASVAASDRLVGGFAGKGRDDGSYFYSVQDPSGPGTVISVPLTSNSAGTEYSFPVLGQAGPVINTATGLCLTFNSPGQVVYAQVCDGSAAQSWTTENGENPGTYRFALWDGANMSYLGEDQGYGQKLIAASGGWGGAINVPQSQLSVVSLAPLTATVDSVDSEAMSAVVVGTGEPGATVTIVGPGGTVSTTIGADGKWTKDVSGLVAGDNALEVTQTADGVTSAPVNLTVTIVAVPIMPLAAGVGALGVAVGAGVLVVRNRRLQGAAT